MYVDLTTVHIVHITWYGTVCLKFELKVWLSDTFLYLNCPGRLKSQLFENQTLKISDFRQVGFQTSTVHVS